MVNIFDFVAKLAWPIVALIGILILGPGGVLKSIVGELADKLLHITSSIAELKKTAEDFNQTQRNLSTSTTWMSELHLQLQSITNQLDTVKKYATESVIKEAVDTFQDELEADENTIGELDKLEKMTPETMYQEIEGLWKYLTDKIQKLVGDAYDGRAIGQMASKLSHGKRKQPLPKKEAERIGHLHSNWKSFNRLKSSKSEWLTPEVYTAFIQNVKKASASLDEISLT